MTFKVGDRVRAVTDLYQTHVKGDVGVIALKCPGDRYVYVEFAGRIGGNWFDESSFELLPTDTDRLRFLAGCGTTDGPTVEFIMVEDFYDVLGDVMIETDKSYDTEVREPTDDEKLEAFRRLVDKAMEVKP